LDWVNIDDRECTVGTVDVKLTRRERTAMASSPGGRVRELRDKQQLTQQALAERAGMSVSFLSEIENDHRNPSGRILVQLATALSTTMDYILRGAEPAPVATREPVAIPPELAAAAERSGLSYRATATLFDAYRQIVARRGTEPEKPPSPEEWLAMYYALKKYIEG
jgi:transcriptional regulator with XRE-family HTH domain